MKKNIAIIGCGYWGKNLVRVFHDLGVLCAICDCNSVHLKNFVKYRVDFYGDYKLLLENEKIKAVVIATPVSTHYTIAKESLLAGKDVFVEKPLAMKYEEGKELAQLAQKRDRVLMVGHILEYHPAIVRLKELISDGKLGKINYIYSNRLNLGKFRAEENVLLSFAPHDISVILGLVGEMPNKVMLHEGSYISENVSDITITAMEFLSGVKAHIFVSWLHPYKEQKLIVVGSKAMVVFDDMAENKLLLYSHKIKWTRDRIPIARKSESIVISIEKSEPLKNECEHFMKCIKLRCKPITDSEQALGVLKVLDMCRGEESKKDYFIHESSYIDKDVGIGEGTKIWHFSHIMRGSKIGKNCVIGQNVMIGPNVTIGDNVKIQNNVSVYDGVTLEDDVFCGPSCVFTNVINPRSGVDRKSEFKKTLVKKGATIGANATIICGVTIYEYAFVGAGAVVTRDVPPYALVYGAPAEIKGKMDERGDKI